MHAQQKAARIVEILIQNHLNEHGRNYDDELLLALLQELNSAMRRGYEPESVIPAFLRKQAE